MNETEKLHNKAMTGDQMVRVIAVTSGKGGVGKTNVSVNLAISLAEKGQKVLLMDADLGLANVDVMLGLRPEFDLYHVITGEKTLEEVMISGPGGISIIPASSGIGKMAELNTLENAGLINAFDEISKKVDVLIIDTAAGISDSVVSFAKASHEIIVTLCDEPASITDAYALIKVLNKEHGVQRFQVLANMVKDSKQGKQLYAKLARVSDDYLDVSLGYLGSIPMDDKLKVAVQKQQAVTILAPHSSSGVAFQCLAEKVFNMPDRESSEGNLAFFVEHNSMTSVSAGSIS